MATAVLMDCSPKLGEGLSAHSFSIVPAISW